MVTADDALATTEDALSERDLAVFVGRNAGRFLHAHHTGRILPGRCGRFALAWSWPAGLIPVPWLLYRKMYLVAFCYVASIVGLGLTMPEQAANLALLVTALMTILGKGLYLHHAERRIRRADARGLTGPARDDYLARAGGVSVAAAVFGTVFIVSIIVLTSFSIILAGG